MSGSPTGQFQDNFDIGFNFADGSSVTVTSEQVYDYYQNSNADDRQADTTMWIKQQLINAAGSEAIGPNNITVIWSTDDGTFQEFTRHA